ncbi:MAG: efflux RND transporter periplasmic adaptor subunit [Verrucomicrobiia bacterium]
MSALLAVGGAGLVGCSRSGDGHEGHIGAQAKQRYHCPMHPTYVAGKPGDCPICGMKLVAIKDAQTTVGAAARHEGQSVPGRISISLSADKRQMIGLTLAKVEKRELTHTVRATAVVMHDETRYARVAPRFGGWVRKLHVNFTGAPVEKGQPLFTVYSPELFATENEYLIAWRSLQQLKVDVSTEQRNSATNLLNSARRRLELWEIGDGEIRALEQRGTPSDEMLFRAPFTGHVVAKTAVEGKAFTAGESLYEVADLAHLWLDAWVFEPDLPLMKLGLQATITFSSLGNKTFTAPITFLYPHIDPQTRRGRVRLELDNPDHLLRPDMWASVTIQIPLGEKVLIPASAVIDTGQRFVAFVDGEDGHLQPRELKVGAKTDDYYEVLDGVKEGEKVVTRALFLVDSESQLKAAIAGMGASHQHSAAAPKQPMEPIPSVLAHYAKIQTALAGDSLAGVTEAAQTIAKLVTDDPMKMLPAAVASQAGAVADVKDIATARDRFKILSASLIEYLERENVQTGQYVEVYCDMAKASWLQMDRKNRNPYYGKEMIECGEIRRAR